MDGKGKGKGVAIISSGGGGRDRSTDNGLHTEPSGHFKLYSASLRVKYRAREYIFACSLDLTRD